MKSDKSPQDDATLSKLVREWKVAPALPPRFNKQVWQRIDRAEMPALSPLAAWGQWLARIFRKPALAFSYMAVLLVAGGTLGFWQGRTTSHRTADELGDRYVRMMNAYESQR